MDINIEKQIKYGYTLALYKLGVLNEDDYNKNFDKKLLAYIIKIKKKDRKNVFQQIKNFNSVQISCLEYKISINITKHILCNNTKKLYKLGVLNEDDYNKKFSRKLLEYIQNTKTQDRKKIFQQIKKFTNLQIDCLKEGMNINTAKKINNINTKKLHDLGALNKDDYGQEIAPEAVSYIKDIEEEYRKNLFKQIKKFNYHKINDLKSFFVKKDIFKPAQCLFNKENLLDYLIIIEIYKHDKKSRDKFKDIEKLNDIDTNKFNNTIAVIKENKIPIIHLMFKTQNCNQITRNSFFSLLLNRNTTFEIPFEVIKLLNDNTKLESLISIATHSKIEEYHFKEIFPKYDYLFFEKEFIINMLMVLTGFNYDICINIASYLNIQDFKEVILPNKKEFINAKENNNKGKLLNSWQEKVESKTTNMLTI